MGKIYDGLLVVVMLVCCFCAVTGEQVDVRVSLVSFLGTLAGGDEQAARSLGWNASLDPCGGGGGELWASLTCHDRHGRNAGRIKSIVIEGRGMNGTVDAALLCAAPELRVVSLRDNELRGGLPADISVCAELTHLYVGGNRLFGSLPRSLGQLKNLKMLNVSSNYFSGELPGELGGISGLQALLANDNHFTGAIPDFDLTNFRLFNVSNNNLTGAIPEKTGGFGADCFLPNAAGLCGQPLLEACPPSPSSSPQPSPPSLPSSGDGKKNKSRVEKVVMYLGYVLLGSAVLLFVAYKIASKRKARSGDKGAFNGGKSTPTTTTTMTTTKSTSATKSVYSLQPSAEQSMVAGASASLVVLRRMGTMTSSSAAAMKDLRFEDLLKSPAELLGRGRLGSSYKVVLAGGTALAVKRVKDTAVPAEEFRRRMERVGQARHAAVLPPVGFYCAMQEKLVVYEFQSNGSLANLLHGSIETSQAPLDWPARLHVAAKVADGMSFMHDALRGDGSNSSSSSSSGSNADDAIGHGNLKASNILFTASMEPCISEYGVTASPAGKDTSALHADVRAFGVLLLELLTGKATAQGDGSELARWVNSVIREEWTAEVFDKALAAAGASEQRMVQLLQVALRCADASAAPPSMREVAEMAGAIREEDERSMSTSEA